MTTTTTTFNGKKTALWGLGLGLLALPFAMPSAAHADTVRVSLNFGGAPYGYTYHQPVVQKVVYRPAPVKRVVHVKRAPQRVVYVNNQHGHKKHWKQERRGQEHRRVAYYY